MRRCVRTSGCVILVIAFVIGCLPGDRALRTEVVNTCGFNILVRLAFNVDALRQVAAEEIEAGKAAVVRGRLPRPQYCHHHRLVSRSRG